MKIVNAPDGLTSVVLITREGEQYGAEHCEVPDAVPFERRQVATMLRELADAIDRQADDADLDRSPDEG